MRRTGYEPLASRSPRPGELMPLWLASIDLTPSTKRMFTMILQQVLSRLPAACERESGNMRAVSRVEGLKSASTRQE